MSESSKTPRAKVEGAPDQRPAAEPAAEPRREAPEGAAPSASGSGDDRPEAGAFERMLGWVSRSFPGHEHAFWGGVCGLLVAVLVFALGIFRTLIVALIVLVGVALGQAADGDPKIIDALRRFFSANN